MVHINWESEQLEQKHFAWKDIGMVTGRKHLQTARLPSCGCEGKAGILVEHHRGYNLGFIMYVLPQLV